MLRRDGDLRVVLCVGGVVAVRESAHLQGHHGGPLVHDVLIELRVKYFCHGRGCGSRLAAVIAVAVPRVQQIINQVRLTVHRNDRERDQDAH